MGTNQNRFVFGLLLTAVLSSVCYSSNSCVRLCSLSHEGLDGRPEVVEFTWEIGAFGISSFQGILMAQVDFSDSSSSTGAAFLVTTDLSNLKLTTPPAFQRVFDKVMSLDPFDCQSCEVELSIVRDSTLGSLTIGEMLLSGHSFDGIRGENLSDESSVTLFRDQMGIDFSHLGAKGSVLNRMLGNEITIKLSSK